MRIVLVWIALAGCRDRDVSSPPPPTPVPVAPAPQPPPPVDAAVATPDAPPHVGIALTFDADPVGEPPRGIEPVIGDWAIAEQDGARGLLVDGTHWRNGTPSASLADQAKRMYGDRYAEFLDGIKAFAFFPLAVVPADPPAGDVRMSIRFYPIAGQIDQGAGIAFGVLPDGSYWGVRANALEDNLLYFHVVKGKRTVLDVVRDTATPTRQWHTLTATLRGTDLDVELDGKPRFHKKLTEVPRGRVGLWSKADSKVLFDELRVEPL
jgi:hypothetical protein